MENLPKRDDDIYKEIESFADYELTQCVAYEMAVRNEDVTKLYHSIGLDGYSDKDHIENIVNIISIVRDFGEDIELLSKYGIDYIDVHMYLLEKDLITKNGDKRGSAIVYIPYNTKIKDLELTKDELSQICNIEIQLYNQEPWTKQQLTNDEEFLKMAFDLEYPFCDESVKIMKKALKRKSLINIEDKFSRPKLKLESIPTINLDINMALPEKELLAYITELKRTYSLYDAEIDADENKIYLQPKTPLEFLGENLAYATPRRGYPKKANAEKYADMFFIYDYVKARLNYIEAENKIIKAEHKKNIELINKNKDLSTKQKKTQRTVLQAEYYENTIDTKITDIFNEDELKKPLNLSDANISKLYYAIKPYIDDLKYKELVTGARTI